jgi:class 3 adenylate cyclase
MKVAISIHAGRAAFGEVGSYDPPMLMAIGDAVDVADNIRAVAERQDKSFAISEAVYAAAGLAPVFEEKVELPSPGDEGLIAVLLSDEPPVPNPAWLAADERIRRARSLQRLWKG